MNEKSKKLGRPKGAKTIDAPVQEVEVSRCPEIKGGCGSTKRTAYEYLFDRTFDPPQINHHGVLYDKIVWRRCRCLDCGMPRTDKSFELRGQGE